MSTKTAGQEADTLGVLPHLVEHYSAADHPASFKVSRTPPETLDGPRGYKVSFNYEREGKPGEWKRCNASATGTTLDEAASAVRAELVKPADA